MDAQIFLHVLEDGQLLIYVADALSPSIRYLWVTLSLHKPSLVEKT